MKRKPRWLPPALLLVCVPAALIGAERVLSPSVPVHVVRVTNMLTGEQHIERYCADFEFRVGADTRQSNVEVKRLLAEEVLRWMAKIDQFCPNP